MALQYTSPPVQDVATTASGLGAGAGDHLPIGDYGGMDYRSAIRFATPPGWAGWTGIISASLKVYISDHQHVAPKNSSIYCSRMAITAPIWTKDQGSQDCESGFSAGNNTQYGDIASTSTDRFSFSSGSTANAAKTLNVTEFVKYYWSNGAGSGPLVFVFDNNGADQYTELWALGKAGTTYDAILTINYETARVPANPLSVSPADGATLLDDTPTLAWTPDTGTGAGPQTAAEVQLYDAGGVAIGSPWAVAGAATTFDVPTPLARGVTYKWAVRTQNATGWSTYGLLWAFTVKANPVVTISAVRKMVYSNDAPRLVVEWTTDQPQGQYRVTGPSGYDSTWKTGGEQSHTLDALALTNGTAANITVEVRNTDSPALTGSASRSFTPRWGLTTHKKTLAGVPVNWQAPVVVATVPAGASLVIEYGSAGSAAAGAPTSGWFPSITSVPKTQYLWWRAWFIPSATNSPVLDSIDIPYDQTTAVLDKWGVNAVWPWEDSGALPAQFTIDTGESVYGTRALRLDCDGTTRYIISTLFKVRQGRSYVMSGLMRSQGNSGAYFQLQSGGTALAVSEDPAHPGVQNSWTPGVLTDWARYRTPVWKASADMDVFVVMVGGGVSGATAWFDGIKVEEAIVATPWSPASVGATTLDAGGVQIDGTKGGLLRYRGTAGGVRDVVEGGANGLRFGGDTEVRSPSPGLLEVVGGAGAESLGLTGYIAPVITADQTAWAPAGITTAFFVLAQPNAARAIHGIVPTRNGHVILLWNASGNPLTLKYDSASATDTHRLITKGFADVVLGGFGSALLAYSTVQGRWLVHTGA